MALEKKAEAILKELENKTRFNIDRTSFYDKFRKLKPKEVSYKTPRQESVIVRAGGKGLAVRRIMPSGEISDVCECNHNGIL